MTLTDIFKVIDALSDEERTQVRDYLAKWHKPVLTPEERIRMIDEAVTGIREGMSQAELDQLTEDMNAEYLATRC